MARRCPQLHLAGAIAVVTFLTLDGFAAAQDPAGRFGRVVPLEGAAQTKAGVELLHDQDRRVDRVRWGRSELRLSRPVHTCKVGTAAGGRLLVILAGGVHAELSLYLASGDGELRRYSTGGGRLLSRAFNGAASFWPAVEGRHLVLFGFARNADQNPDVELRALDFDAPGGVRVLASRRLPPTASGWTVRHDRDDGLVRIDIDGVKDPTQRQLEFRHPLAPVLRASSGQLQFGEHRPGTQTRRDLWLENPGSRPVKGLRLEQPLPTGFELAGSMPDTLAPGAKHTLAVRFAPRGPGTFRGPLRLTAEGGRPIAPVELIGSAVVESRRAAPAPVAPPAPVVQKPRPPELAEVRAYPRGAGEVLVLGRVRAAGAAWVKLRSGATERVLRVDRSGRFHAELAAPAGAQLLLASLGPTRRESEFVPLCTVPAMLECARGAALVRGLPHQAFLLVAESQGRVLRCWRGETDAGGTRRVPLDILGGPPGAGLTLRAVVGVAGVLQSSPVIVPGA